MQMRLCQVVLLGLTTLPVAAACTSQSLAESPAVPASSPDISLRAGAFGNFAPAHSSGDSGPVEQVLEIDVAHETMRCTQTSEDRCLQIRRDANAPWELYAREIDGFEHEAGYRYHLRIEQTPAENPAAEAADWRLVDVLDKQRVIPDTVQRPSSVGLDGPGLTGGR
ncbi:DUF4377 domain-containing protein [Nocardia sp. NPDC127579]|uniref:DUF4377 domain-containing protein n=1 Tax=Nocardia sp. NPDC127579 TaxID=3345402 RepID=UPI00362F99D8